MSRILEFVIGIFTFADPVASTAMYLALIIVPGVAIYLGKKYPQKSEMIFGWTFKSIAGLIAVMGIVLFALISASSTDLEIENISKVDGKEVKTVELRGGKGMLTLIDGGFFEVKTLTESNKEAFMESMKRDPNKFIEHEGVFYALTEIPEIGNIQKLYFKDGSTLKIVDGQYWDQGSVGASLQLSILIVFVCFGLMLGFGLSKFITDDPKKAIKSLIIFGGLLLVFIIGYQMEGIFFNDLSDDFLTKMSGRGEEVSSQDQVDAGGGLVITFIMIVIATILALFGGFIFKFIRR